MDERVAAYQVIARGQPWRHLHVELVRVQRQGRRVDEAVRPGVGRRKQREEVKRLRRLPLLRDDPAGKWVTQELAGRRRIRPSGERVEDRPPAAEIASQLAQGG